MFNSMKSCSDCGKLVLLDEMIIIPVAEYESLKDAALDLKVRSYPDFRAISHSAIARNKELANFILEGSVTMTVSETFIQAKAKFGKAVPSRSSVYRFIQMMRRAR